MLGPSIGEQKGCVAKIGFSYLCFDQKYCSKLNFDNTTIISVFRIELHLIAVERVLVLSIRVVWIVARLRDEQPSWTAS